MNLNVEPDRRCAKHADQPTEYPCGKCATAREEHQEWTRAKAAADAVQRAHDTRQRAADRAAEIARCRLCDDDGYASSGALCHHDPGAGERARRGAKACREAMESGRKSSESDAESARNRAENETYSPVTTNLLASR